MCRCFQFFTHVGDDTSKKEQDFSHLSNQLKKITSQEVLQVPGVTSGRRMTHPFCPVTSVRANWWPSHLWGVLACTPPAGAEPGHPGASWAPRELNLKWWATYSPCYHAGKVTSTFTSQLQQYYCLIWKRIYNGSVFPFWKIFDSQIFTVFRGSEDVKSTLKK